MNVYIVVEKFDAYDDTVRIHRVFANREDAVKYMRKAGPVLMDEGTGTEYVSLGGDHMLRLSIKRVY